MDSVERVKMICRERKIPIAKLERECGFSNGYIHSLKEGKFSANRLYTIAKYLNVSPEYLLTGQNSEKESTSGQKYYFDDDTAAKAQELFENPGMRVLFDAARGSRPEDLQIAADLLARLKESNPDG